jgi:hypothetical protein
LDNKLFDNHIAEALYHASYAGFWKWSRRHADAEQATEEGPVSSSHHNLRGTSVRRAVLSEAG